MPALKRVWSLFLAIELREASTTTGTYQGQTGKMLPIDPSLEFELPRYERNVYRRTNGQLQSLTGIRMGRARFGLELAASDGPNQFQDTLHCCGMADEPVSKHTIGPVTGGPFRHGETVTQASSGASGIVVSDTWDGMPFLWIAQNFQFGDGTFDATGVLVGSSTGAQATPSAFVANGGRAWWPFTPSQSILQFDPSGLLFNVTAGDLIRGLTSGAAGSVFYSHAAGTTESDLVTPRQVVFTRQHSHFLNGEVIENVTRGQPNIGTLQAPGGEIGIRNGTASIGLIKDHVRERIDWARGTFKLSGKIGEPAIFDFEFLGAERSVLDQGLSLHPDTSSIHVPPLMLGTSVMLGYANDPQSALKSSCIRSFVIDVGHELAIQECMALTVSHGPFFGPPHDTDTPRGVDMAIIVARKPTITIDPLVAPESDFPWVDALLSNRALRMQMTIGTTAPDKFYISCPSISPGSIGSGDYNGISTRNILLELNGGDAPGPRGDNELVIINEF